MNLVYFAEILVAEEGLEPPTRGFIIKLIIELQLFINQ